MHKASLVIPAMAIVMALSQAGCSQERKVNSSSFPRLSKVDQATQLVVDDKPFLILGGELGNSTASDLDVLDRAFQKCQRMNLNTVMTPVYWDQLESEEGQFDFTLVKGAIDRARSHHLRLVVLWFGTWKNSMSCYAPAWVKRDTARFARARRSSGETDEIISAQSMRACEADARAFGRLMRWIKEYDGQQHTVLMVQVENEVGMIPEARDHSDAAERAYASAVPEPLLRLVCNRKLGPEVDALWDKAGRRSDGTWAEVFGSEAEGEEVFSAWSIASYVEKVAAAGKREYPLPMFANAALIRPGYRPGQYPSAGPLPHLLEVWHLAAPSLDMICPDIYFPNFIEWCGRYTRNGNPLFIPEMAPSIRTSANAVYAISQFRAIGCGPFSIENTQGEKERLITNCYGQLAAMADLILKGQQTETIVGLSPNVGFDWSIQTQPPREQLAGIVFEGHFDRASAGDDSHSTTLATLGSGRWEAPPATPQGAVLILQTGSDEFVMLGLGATVTFSCSEGRDKVGIDRVEEGTFVSNGEWKGGRWLNGDETHQGRHVHFDSRAWSILRVRLYRYE